MAETEPMLISEAVQEEEPAIDEPPPEPKEAEEEEEREAEPPAEEAEPPAEEASVEPQEDGMEESGEHFKSKFRETERRTFGRSEATESGEASTEGAPAEDVPAEPEAAAEDERASQVRVCFATEQGWSIFRASAFCIPRYVNYVKYSEWVDHIHDNRSVLSSRVLKNR